jgi:hypothetical protein
MSTGAIAFARVWAENHCRGDSMTNGQRSGDRDLRILQAFADGAPVEELAVRFGLSRERVGTIIRAERLKVEVSPLPEYRALRSAMKL